MENREIVRNVLNQFFLIFTVIIIAMLIINRLTEEVAVVVATNDILAALLLAALTSLAGIVVYSKKDPKRAEALARSVIHFLIVLGICLTIATIVGWISWATPFEVALWIGIFVAVYFIISLIDYFQTKKLADDLNTKLKQRYGS